MSALKNWLKETGLVYTMAGETCLVFDPPPRLGHAHGAAVTSGLANGKNVAQLLRARGWAAYSTSNEAQKLKWLMSLGYERKTGGPAPVLRVPTVEVFGAHRINLVVVATRIASNPRITSRRLASQLTAKAGKPIGRMAVNRAMNAVGWGPEEREAYRCGAIPAPVLDVPGTPVT